jgi:hypothetical protein
MPFPTIGKRSSFPLAVCILAALVGGCSGVFPVDDQTDISAPIRELVNPAPTERDFAANNQSHRLLVAVLDTGVDYNHAELGEHLHFELNADRRPLRLGWDYVGHDGWPCPYLGRRSVFVDFELALIERLIAADGGLAAYLDPRRNVAQEYLASAWHGTAIAGLIVEGTERIGLLPYRVVPPNVNQTSGHSYTEQIMSQIIAASRQAIADGADIVVITGFFHIAARETPEKFRRASGLKNRFAHLVRSSQHVLFIASAGNFPGYTFSGDEGDRIDFPAGIVAKNFLVVASLAEDGGISMRSSIPGGKIRCAYARGQCKNCLYPEKMLSLSQRQLKCLPSLLDALREGNETYESVAANLRLYAASDPPGGFGTSFAMGRAANLCARLWLNDSELSPADIIEKIMAATREAFSKDCRIDATLRQNP